MSYPSSGDSGEPGAAQAPRHSWSINELMRVRCTMCGQHPIRCSHDLKYMVIIDASEAEK